MVEQMISDFKLYKTFEFLAAAHHYNLFQRKMGEFFSFTSFFYAFGVLKINHLTLNVKDLCVGEIASS